MFKKLLVSISRFISLSNLSYRRQIRGLKLRIDGLEDEKRNLNFEIRVLREQSKIDSLTIEGLHGVIQRNQTRVDAETSRAAYDSVLLDTVREHNGNLSRQGNAE